jgi:hypothetical protein
MAGNEILVIKFLLGNKNRIYLDHLGIIKSISNPNSSNGDLVEIESTEIVSTEDAAKKADVFLNGFGVSIKQSGGNFPYNRIQRKTLLDLLTKVGFYNPQLVLDKFDALIFDFHQGNIVRNVNWRHVLSEHEFKQLLSYLMLKGSPIRGISKHPADFILTSSRVPKSVNDLKCQTFDEYFNENKNLISFAIRRHWIGQDSKTEHGRATKIASVIENKPWVFNGHVGEPRSGWMKSHSPSQRKTTYTLSIEAK